MPSELETTEENTAEELAAQQESNLANQQLNQVISEGQQYGRPSLLKYSPLFAIAGLIDLTDLLDFTGIGIIISKIVSSGGTAIIYGILWLTNGKIKKAGEYGKNLEASMVSFQSKVKRTSQVIGKIPGLNKITSKNPALKILAGGGINLIPWVGTLNPMLLWVYAIYRDEKNTYRQAQEAALEAAQQFEATQTA